MMAIVQYTREDGRNYSKTMNYRKAVMTAFKWQQSGKQNVKVVPV